MKEFDQFVKSVRSKEELSEWMSKNLKYGYRDSRTNKVLTGDIDGQVFYRNYKTMSPEEVYKYRAGVCIDQAEFARYIFSKKNWCDEYKLFYIELDDMVSTLHLFLAFKKGNYYYHFENSYEIMRGINGPFPNYKALIVSVYNTMLRDSTARSGQIREVGSVSPGLSTLDFMNESLRGAKIFI